METFELIYDYEEALARLHKNTSDIDELRSALELESDVPKSVTDKQVSKLNENKEIFISNFDKASFIS